MMGSHLSRRAKSQLMNRQLAGTIKLYIAMDGMTIVCTIVWQGLVIDRLYNCTDDAALPDYLLPGMWVHHPVAAQIITNHRSLSEPDTVKEGWGMTGLWILWFSFVLASVVVSVLL